MFVPTNQEESSFRYLGTQKVDKRATFAVGFAQDPKLVKVPGVIETERGEAPLLYQGVAWIDQETYKIVRMRTDVLAPLPSIKLLQATSTVSLQRGEDSEVRRAAVAAEDGGDYMGPGTATGWGSCTDTPNTGCLRRLRGLCRIRVI